MAIGEVIPFILHVDPIFKIFNLANSFSSYFVKFK